MKTTILAVLSLLTLAACSTAPRPGPGAYGRPLTVCFHNFNDSTMEQAYYALQDAPGASRVARVGYAGDARCYRLVFDRDPDLLERWLKRRLPHPDRNYFTTRWSSHGSRLDLMYDGGFD